MPRQRLLSASLVGGGVAMGAIAALVLVRLVTGPTGPVAEAPPSPLTFEEPTDADAPYRVWSRNPDGSPVRWDPCRPIRWVLETEGAPENARALVSQAMGMVERASGLTFLHEGTTTEQPSSDRSLVEQDGDTTTWAPVLVSWATPDETDLPLGDTILGVAVPVAVRDGDRRVFTTGQVVLNADRTGGLLPGFQDRHATWGSTLVHELAHLVGLDHVDDPTQLLAPTPGFGPIEFGAGDLAGLAEVGSGGCLPVPAAQDLQVEMPRLP